MVEGMMQCQTVDCENRATALLQSKRDTDLELSLCVECAGRYYTEGWKRIRGNVELKE